MNRAQQKPKHCRYSRVTGLSPEIAVQPSWGRRLAGVEGIRGLAAILVVTHHSTRYLTDGREAIGGIFSLTEMASHGLTVFFVLSGFLLYRPFASHLIRGTSRPSIPGYFRNRLLRIVPAYLTIFLIANFLLQTLVLANPIQTIADGGSDVLLGRIENPWTFVANVFMVQSYAPDTLMTGIGPAWSLGTELAFYLVLPALFALGAALMARALRPLAAALTPALLMFVIGVVTSLLLVMTVIGRSPAEQLQMLWGSSWLAVLDKSLLGQAELFALGMSIAVVVVYLEGRGLSVTMARTRYSLLLAGLVVVAVGARFGDLVATTVVGVGAAVLVLSTVLPGRTAQAPNRVAQVLELVPLRYLGLISYSVYLWHEPLAWWVREHIPHDPSSIVGWVASLLIVIAITLALASATYFLVERPAMRLKVRTDRTSRSTGASESRRRRRVNIPPTGAAES